MNKFLISIIVLAVIGIGYGAYTVTTNDADIAAQPEPHTTLTAGELPDSALPLDELPDDYLAEITVADGTSVADRLAIVEAELHTGNSGDYVRQNFPDLDFLFSWDGPPEYQNRRIFPFFYYYSEEADTTFVICNINKTVAMCDGVQDAVIEKGVDSDHCSLARPFEDSFL